MVEKEMFEFVPVPADICPCPFCSGSSKVVVLGVNQGANVYGVVCLSCFSVGKPSLTPMQAAYFWNKRTGV